MVQEIDIEQKPQSAQQTIVWATDYNKLSCGQLITTNYRVGN